MRIGQGYDVHRPEHPPLQGAVGHIDRHLPAVLRYLLSASWPLLFLLPHPDRDRRGKKERARRQEL